MSVDTNMLWSELALKGVKTKQELAKEIKVSYHSVLEAFKSAEFSAKAMYSIQERYGIEPSRMGEIFFPKK